MLIGLIGTLFQTKRDGRLTATGWLVAVLVLCSGLAALGARYLGEEAAAAQAAEAEAQRQAAVAREEQGLQELESARQQIARLEAELTASRDREERVLLRTSDVELVVTLRYGFRDLERLMANGVLADRIDFLIDHGAPDAAEQRISAEAVALCNADPNALCLLDVMPDLTDAEKAANPDWAEYTAPPGALAFSAAYESQLWQRLRDGPVTDNLYPPEMAILLDHATDCAVPPAPQYQVVLHPGPEARHLASGTNTTANPNPLCVSQFGTDDMWTPPLMRQYEFEAMPPDVLAEVVNPRMDVFLNGADAGQGWGIMDLAFTYTVKMDSLARIESLAGRVLILSTDGLITRSADTATVDPACGPEVSDIRVGLTIEVRGDGQQLAIDNTDLAFFDWHWESDYRGLRAPPGTIGYDPATMWQIDVAAGPCVSALIVRFPENGQEIGRFATPVVERRSVYRQ